MLRHSIHTLFGMVLILVSCSEKSSTDQHLASGEQVSYNFHVRPILSDNCYACHGPDANKREAGLRLDNPEGAYAALKENPGAHAVVPGNPGQSEVVRRIFSDDLTELMPPPESNLKLTSEEKETIKKWIRQGGEYEPHWAFVVPEKAPLPKISTTDWAKNEIDHFILSKLERLGLEPNGPAEKMHLLKRLSIDLTGLPPAMEVMEEYARDDSPQATEKIINRLLDSPAYGERMAVLWMDISRYSDSYGYQDDNIRTQWPYRDWVIHAFNKNLPYDEFITWQLAGDMIPGATKEHILATAFNRNHKYTKELSLIHI